MPQEAIDAALNPPAGVGPLPAGPSTFEGVLPAAELKRRAEPVLLRGVGCRACRRTRSSAASWRSTRSTTTSATTRAWWRRRARALRLGWQGVYARWIGEGFPPPFAVTVSFYNNPDGAHKDLREIYEPDEPHNPPQWKEVPSPVTLGEETIAQVGTGQNEGRIWISWRRGGTVYTVSQNITPGDPQSFDEIARLAKIVDGRAVANP